VPLVAVLVVVGLVLHRIVSSTIDAAMRGNRMNAEMLNRNMNALTQTASRVQSQVDRLSGQGRVNELTGGYMAGVYAIIGLLLGLTAGLASAWILLDSPRLWQGWRVLFRSAGRGFLVILIVGLLSFVVAFALIPRVERRLRHVAEGDGTKRQVCVVRFLDWFSGKTKDEERRAAKKAARTTTHSGRSS
jgi:MFS family permease